MALGLLVCPWLQFLISRDEKPWSMMNKMRSDILPTVGCNPQIHGRRKDPLGGAKQGVGHLRGHDHSQVTRPQGSLGFCTPNLTNKKPNPAAQAWAGTVSKYMVPCCPSRAKACPVAVPDTRGMALTKKKRRYGPSLNNGGFGPAGPFGLISLNAEH